MMLHNAPAGFSILMRKDGPPLCAPLLVLNTDLQGALTLLILKQEDSMLLVMAATPMAVVAPESQLTGNFEP
jgi:hypothetical protein